MTHESAQMSQIAANLISV